MIDIHSHLIANVDDGSRSLETSLLMIREEVEQGVTDIICTPHLRRRYALSREEIEKAFNLLVSAVKEQNIPVNLYLGREVYSTNNMVKSLLQRDNLFTLNDKNVILLEFDFTEETDIADVVYEFSARGYKVIVAHLERYEYITVEDAFDIKEAGGLIQVNADSILGKQGGKCKKKAKAFFKNQLVDFVASDMHFGRKNCMAKAKTYVEKKFGKEISDKVFITNAREILEG